MQAEVDAVGKPRMPLVKHGQGLGPAARKALLLPDLVEPARVAAIAEKQVLAADPQPARNPDVDGVGLAQSAPCHPRDWQRRGRHEGNARLTDRRHDTIDRATR